MVWDAASTNELGKLINVEENIDSIKYQQILSDGLMSSLDYVIIENSPIFRDDLAPEHNLKFTKDLLYSHNIDVLDCPSNSTDLNHIENIWIDMEFMIRK